MFRPGIIFWVKTKMTNFFHECVKLTTAISTQLKDKEEDSKKLDSVRRELLSLINKNFPDMEIDYYKKIID